MQKLRTPAAIAIGCALFLAACGGGGDGDRVEDEGRRDRAVGLLVEWGLPTDEAECLVDELGAATVVESPDAGVLSDSDEYRDAAEECIS